MQLSNQSEDQAIVRYTESRLVRTSIRFSLFLVPSSFMPEERVLFWLTINMSIALLLTAINYLLWKINQKNRVRYFSLHSLVMMTGMAFYSMSPVFKGLFPSMLFWVLLGTVVVFCILLFSNADAIGAAFLNPQKKVFKYVILFYAGILLFIGTLFWFFLFVTNTPSWIGIAVIFFFIGVFFLMVSPAMLITPERAKELASGRN